MTRPASRLGKGLSALIAPRATRLETAGSEPRQANDRRDALPRIPLDSIAPNPRQPRAAIDDATLAELADSIRTTGLLQPIVVRSMGDGRYELVAGERRWRAARLAGLTDIPALVREMTDAQSFEAAIVENLQRTDLAPLERAAAYRRYLDMFGGTIDDLAHRLSESRANVSNYLRLLDLQHEIFEMLQAGALGMGQARAIAGITDHQRQLAIARLAARRSLSVRQVEELARSADSSAIDVTETAALQDESHRRHFAEIEQSLIRAVGLPVRIHPGRKKNSGRVVITYNSLDEFDLLAVRLGASATLE